jgi:hypothetical protein
MSHPPTPPAAARRRDPALFHLIHGGLAALVLAVAALLVWYVRVQTQDEAAVATLTAGGGDGPAQLRASQLSNKAVMEKRLQVLEARLDMPVADAIAAKPQLPPSDRVAVPWWELLVGSRSTRAPTLNQGIIAALEAQRVDASAGGNAAVAPSGGSNAAVPSAEAEALAERVAHLEAALARLEGAGHGKPRGAAAAAAPGEAPPPGGSASAATATPPTPTPT